MSRPLKFILAGSSLILIYVGLSGMEARSNEIETSRLALEYLASMESTQ